MHRPVVALVFSVGIAVAVSVRTPASANDCLVFGRQFDEKDVAGPILSDNIMLALNTVGICITARPLPGKRITQALVQGEIDGEFARVPSYLDLVGNTAVLVEEPVVGAAGYIVTRNPTIATAEGLGDGPLGVLRGFVWQEEAAQAASHVAAANSYEQLAEMFINKRVEAILIDEYNLERYPELANWPKAEVVQIKAYIVLHRRRAALRSAIGKAIRFYKSTGCVFERFHGGPACGLRNPPAAANR